MVIAETKIIIPRDMVEANKYRENHWVVFPHQKGEYKRPAAVFMAGLYLELKKEGEKLYPGPRAKNRFKSKDGKEYKNAHVMEQADCLHDLRQRGYCAEFAIGFDAAKKIIDEYLGGK